MAFKLGERSRKELEGVHADLVKVVEAAIAITPIDFGVHDGLRTEEEQRRYLETGVSMTMDSKHLRQADGFGHAVDLVPYVNGKLRWEWPVIYPIAAAVHQAATALKVPLRWGGVWDMPFLSLPGSATGLEESVLAYAERRRALGRRAFLDGPHYELITA